MPGTINIETWLEALGLEAYAQAFVDNDIDLDLLSDLTVEDLRDIGISSVGHRRKILSAAAEIASTQTAQNQSMPAKTDDDPGMAERRVLTVMFCDLVDSISLSAASDAEDFREFIAQFRQDVETAIRPFGGTVSQFLGDGVMASFGYPRASGHDAERAVAAGLAVIDRVNRLPDFAGKPPQVRIGIATGLTVVGAIDSGVSLRDESAIGDTPNLASRLQDHAAPNTMVIAQQTRDLIGNIFECAKLGEVSLKGFVTPVAAFKVLGRGSTASRYEAMRTNSRSNTFIGRKAELSALADHCTKMRSGAGKLLVVEGETGIGKSCLVQQGLSAVTPQIAEPVVLQCSPYSTNMQFFAVRYLIAPALGDLKINDHGGVRKWLSSFGQNSEEAAALIVSLMAYSEDQSDALDAFSSDQVRAKIFDLLLDVLRKTILSSGAIIIEDIQWIDPSTAELLTRLLPTIAAGKLVILGTSQSVERANVLVLDFLENPNQF
jgi:class 3 adenylate cyclase